MALINPTQRARLAHVTNLFSLARLDGKITDSEKHYIMVVAKQYKLTEAEIDQCFKESVRVVVEMPASESDKVIFMKNLVSMMLVDGCIDKQKRDLVERIFEKFGYDGKRSVDVIYDELMKEVQGCAAVRQENGNKITEEAFRKELNKRVNKAAQCLMENDMSGAFDLLLSASLADETARGLFLRIARGVYPTFMLSERQVAELKVLSDRDFAVAKYALGRYHQLVQPEENSLQQAYELYTAAANQGLAEAVFGLALFYRDGLLGEVKPQKYIRLRDEAIGQGSFKAFYMKAKDIIYGMNDYEADPKYMCDFVSDIVKEATGDAEKDIFEIEPEYYDLLGRAYQELGDMAKAEDAYIKAVSLGFYESLSRLILMMCYDEEGNLIEQEIFDKYVEFGIQHNDAFCYTMRGDVSQDDYDRLSKREQAQMTEQIKADLRQGCRLGDNIAPWLLGKHYYYGNFGFEENDEEAWKWFSLGAAYSSSECYSMMATMIDEGHCPVEVDEKFRAECLLNAYRHGDDSRLEDVVEAYQKGHLEAYRDEIEPYYLPIYAAQVAADDTRPFDEGIPLIAIIRPDATADIIEFDVENWDELPDFIAADHLDALRIPALYEIGHQAGYEDNVTGWLDSKGLMKGLPKNPIGGKVYPGPVAGDMILTLEDESYQPKSFYDINALRRVLEALGATIRNICLDDDNHDDDGRFDAWS